MWNTHDACAWRSALVRQVGAMALIGALMTTSACGGADPAAPSGGDDATPGPTLTVKFSITGEASINGTATTTPPTNNGIDHKTCADYAMGSKKDNGKTNYVLPEFFLDQVDGRSVLVGALATDYAGPGTYGLDKMSGPGSPAGIEIDSRPYVVHQATTSQLITDAKGGGTWTFTRLAFSDGSGQVSPGINGTISWTCKN